MYLLRVMRALAPAIPRKGLAANPLVSCGHAAGCLQ